MFSDILSNIARSFGIPNRFICKGSEVLYQGALRSVSLRPWLLSIVSLSNLECLVIRASKTYCKINILIEVLAESGCDF